MEGGNFKVLIGTRLTWKRLIWGLQLVLLAMIILSRNLKDPRMLEKTVVMRKLVETKSSASLGNKNFRHSRHNF